MTVDATFTLLVLGAILVYGLAPAFFPFLFFVGLLWLIASYPHLGVMVARGGYWKRRCAFAEAERGV